MIWSSSCWIRSSAEDEEEEEVRSQEVEEEKFCWEWRTKLTILVALRKMFLLADLLIAAEIWRTQCFIIFRTFDFLTLSSTNCNLSLICSRKRFLIITSISPVVEKAAGQRCCVEGTRGEDKLAYSVVIVYTYIYCDWLNDYGDWVSI